MKKIYLVLGVALCGLASCTIQDVVTDSTLDCAKIPMTLTASFAGDSNTKVSFTDNSGLKGTWDANETLSVISCDGSGNVLAVDNFTSSGAAGRTTAEFTGTLSAASPAKIICWYPAVYPIEGEYAYGSTSYDASINGLKFRGIGNMYGRYSFDYINQVADNDLSHIAKRGIMSGTAEVDGSNLTTTLVHNDCVLKCTFTFPESVSVVNSIRASLQSSAWGQGGWFYANNNSKITQGGWDASATIYLGGWQDKTVSLGLDISESHKFTAYFLISDAITISAGKTITFNAYDSFYNICGTCVKTLNSDLTMQNGKLYTMNATLETPTP